MSDDAWIGSTVSHYRILDRLGGGGMGVVYRAEDVRLRRHVALKFLPPWLSRDAEARERFEREAQAASALDHPAVCTIHEIDETADGQIFIAMTLYDGETLKQRLARGRLPIDEAIALAARIAEGLGRAHEQGIIHRDIKPANLILPASGGVKILDFGLAKLADRSGITHSGVQPGTVSYMAPEQIAGGTVDARTDIWAFGIVLYEMLAGRNPFERDRPDAALAATIVAEPASLSTVRPELPAAVVSIVEQALRKVPADRIASAPDIARRLDRILTVRTAASSAKSSRLPIVAGAAVIVCILVFLALQNRARRTRDRALASLPQIAALIDAGRYAEAFPLARAAARSLPRDTAVARMLGLSFDSVSIDSEPAGARVRMVRFDDGSATDTIDAGITPVRNLDVARGDYLVRVVLDGYAPAERMVSSALMRTERAFFRPIEPALRDHVQLVPASESPPDMVFVPGGTYELVSHAAPRGAVADIDGYFIDRFEVTNSSFLQFIRDGGYTNRDYWKHPFMRAGRRLTWEEGIALFVDGTALPGPRSWRGQQFPAGRDNDPVTDISWYEAAAFAEYAGKTLPTLFQWEKAARDGRIAHFEGVIMPWGLEGHGSDARERANFMGSGTMPVDAFAFGMSPYGAYGMAGNVREWTASSATGGHAATGGSWSDPAYLFNAIGIYNDLFAASDLGFRCVRPADPGATRNGDGRLGFADQTPVYEPVDAPTFRALLSHYRYDRTDPNATIVETVETPDWVREKIAFDAPGNDRVLAYLFLPKSATPPYQTIAHVPGSNTFYAETAAAATVWLLGPVIRSGRAVLTVVLEGMIERPFPPGFQPPPPQSVAFRDLMVHHATELRRGLDYLESRSDIDTARIAYVGLSFGAGSRLGFAATDDRFKAVIFIGGGIDERVMPTLPEASSVNFAPYIRAPKLLLNGTTDDEHPWLTRGLPLWNLLREPRELVLVEGAGHVPPVEERIPPISRFLDRVLGPVAPRTTGRSMP